MTKFFTKLPVAAAATFASFALFFGALAPVNATVGTIQVAAHTATDLA